MSDPSDSFHEKVKETFSYLDILSVFIALCQARFTAIFFSGTGGI